MTLTRRLPPLGGSAVPEDDVPGPNRLAAQRLRYGLRIAGAVLVTVPATLVQAVLIVLPGNAKRRFARAYWAAICHVIGIERRCLGAPARHDGRRAVVYISNHTSWLDVPVLGGTLLACFVAKAEVGQWPVVRTIARLGRTEFVSRRVSETGRERDSMRARLAVGDDLILFPEGTSSDGARVLPFRSPFFAITEGGDQPLIQPVSVVFDRIDGLPTGRATRPVSSWYGDMDLGGHFWRLASYRRLRATILLHPPLDPADFASRKELSRAAWQIVATGAAALRQNRPIAAIPDSLDTTAPNIRTVRTN